MKVSELIDKLQKLNQPSAEIAVYHYGIVIDVEPADEYNEVIIRTNSEEDY